MIKLQSLSKNFGNVKAVDNISFKVEKGEIFGFLGMNGAGKTTTILMLMGILKPTSGSASISGYDVISDSVNIKRIVGYLPDEPYLYDYLKGREFLEFLAEIHQLSREEKKNRIPALLFKFGLKNAADDLVINYSHGMKKKLALCGALLHQPNILIMDEPTNGMDPVAVRDFRDLVSGMAKEGHTIFLSTHILDLAEKLCHRVAIIHDGKLIDVGLASPLRENISKKEATLEDIFIKIIKEGNEEPML